MGREASCDAGDIAAKDPQKHRDHDDKGVQGHCDNLWKNKVVVSVNSHYL